MADGVRVVLDTGRVLRVPHAYSSPVSNASEAEQRHVRVGEAGRVVEWPSLGVTLAVGELVRDAHTVVDPGPDATLPLDVTHREEDYT